MEENCTPQGLDCPHAERWPCCRLKPVRGGGTGGYSLLFLLSTSGLEYTVRWNPAAVSEAACLWPLVNSTEVCPFRGFRLPVLGFLSLALEFYLVRTSHLGSGGGFCAQPKMSLCPKLAPHRGLFSVPGSAVPFPA